ncbi:hypothetical protein ACTOJ1_001382 [Shigella flexneri]
MEEAIVKSILLLISLYGVWLLSVDSYNCYKARKKEIEYYNKRPS